MKPFQSRNRESYCFKSADWKGYISSIVSFQSRNRESYCFKCLSAETSPWTYRGFNLVIENLIVSRLRLLTLPSTIVEIRFNLVIENLIVSSSLSVHVAEAKCLCFNLVIENLIVSRLGWSRYGFRCVYPSFNLVIENLIVSSFDGRCGVWPSCSVSIS